MSDAAAMRTWVAFAMFTTALVAAGCGRPTSKESGSKEEPAANEEPPAKKTTSKPKAEEGISPELTEEDESFVDKRKGWGWSDRCWKSLGKNKLANALAECEEGLKIAPEGPLGARPSLLYNRGLIEERLRHAARAKDFFERSLDLRPVDDAGRKEVAQALVRVGGTPKPAPKPDPKVAAKEKEAKCLEQCGEPMSRCYCLCTGECKPSDFDDSAQ